ncbi:DeoR/GlpR family DNA-binding transcription regulator [Brachyspira sp.]|uniref:DeoR/GlpR family DNA-binding transcription regulator n=1 Tax=Brachyspira sp. TaxID=1977261 RepID=UPI0026029079|nr:DeoR/GlpR family DNA-binding transcription regulator [Brachyspira sp.]
MKQVIEKKYLLNFIYKNVNTNINSLKEEFNISTSTVYRLLHQLRDENWIVIDKNNIIYKPFSYINIQEDNTKNIIQNAIAYKSHELINNGDVICLSGSSTTMSLMIPFIVMNKENITMISNSVLVLKNYLDYYNLAVEKNIILLVIGGTIKKQFYAFNGEYVDNIANNLNIEKAFFGTQSIDPQRGLFMDTLLENMVEKKLMEISKKNYLIANYEKFQTKGLFKWADLNELNGIISDINLDDIEFSNKNIEKYIMKIEDINW